jgi:uncharacterized protein (DUF1697 family)
MQSDVASSCLAVFSSMQSFIALLRAVNVGGTGRLPMEELKAMCTEIGFRDVRTYIASGNAIFRSTWSEARVKAALEERLQVYAGKAVGVAMRSAAEMAQIAAANPFADAPGNRVMAIFMDRQVTPDMLDGVTGRAADEFLSLGKREIFIHYASGLAQTKLRIPAAKTGTARNMNTVAKLASLAQL